MKPTLEIIKGTERVVAVRGCLLAIHSQREDGMVCPVTLQLQDGTDLLPIFSTIEKLEASLLQANFTRDQYRVKQIDDADDFISSIPEVFLIALDPWINEEGNTRFTAIKRKES